MGGLELGHVGRGQLGLGHRALGLGKLGPGRLEAAHGAGEGDPADLDGGLELVDAASQRLELVGQLGPPLGADQLDRLGVAQGLDQHLDGAHVEGPQLGDAAAGPLDDRLELGHLGLEALALAGHLVVRRPALDQAEVGVRLGRPGRGQGGLGPSPGGGHGLDLDAHDVGGLTEDGEGLPGVVLVVAGGVEGGSDACFVGRGGAVPVDVGVDCA